LRAKEELLIAAHEQIESSLLRERAAGDSDIQCWYPTVGTTPAELAGTPGKNRAHL
jgi:hypothetical protein